jgi:hypothetical protein
VPLKPDNPRHNIYQFVPVFLSNFEAVPNVCPKVLPVASAHVFDPPLADLIAVSVKRMSHIDHPGTIFAAVSSHQHRRPLPVAKPDLAPTIPLRIVEGEARFVGREAFRIGGFG